MLFNNDKTTKFEHPCSNKGNMLKGIIFFISLNNRKSTVTGRGGRRVCRQKYREKSILEECYEIK